MTVSSQLTADLRKLVLRLEDDLRERLAQDDENLSRWRAEHQGALDAQRTSSAWQAWRDDKVTQAAVAWILTTVFVRFAEDNALVRPVWISGPGARRQEALDAQIVFFRTHPELTDREWLLEPVEYLKKLPATADLVGEHSALWQVQPSGRMATEVLEFWRQTDDAGLPSFDLADTELSTRFLGDLYQDLSDYAKKTFALLQTPEFVEEFILDQTLTPALAERPLEGFKLIDPTCGSGHFLLGAFARLTDAWAAQAPGMDSRARVQKALDSVNGVDLNPFAVAVARFRLTVAALKACNESSLELAPAFNFHLAAGDSLLHGQIQREFKYDGFDADSQLTGFSYSTEDLEQLRAILKPGQYDVVVGNPPYITVDDKVVSKRYRSLYPSCKGTYSLSVPFMERFFQLAKGGSATHLSGWTGQITSNSFLRREFGTRLVENFLPTVDVSLVVDSEGFWIPGHNADGTPTVILVGRNQRPVVSEVRVVQGKGVREPRFSAADGERPMWLSMVRNLNTPGYEDKCIEVSDTPRARLASHPWTLSGGREGLLKSWLDVQDTVGIPAARCGKYGIVGADEPLIHPAGLAKERSLGQQWRPIVVGSAVRNWHLSASDEVYFPYADDHKLLAAIDDSAALWLWPFRSFLQDRKDFSGTYKQSGKAWFGWHQLPRDEGTSTKSIVWAEVATHNHFVALEGDLPLKQTALTFRFPEDIEVEVFNDVLGVLNSSLTCFWLKQRCQPKGGKADIAWKRTYQFNAKNVERVPLPKAKLGGITSRMAAVASELAGLKDRAAAGEMTPELAAEHDDTLRSAIACQEEIDWVTYGSFGLNTALVDEFDEIPPVRTGERAFEIYLAREAASGAGSLEWDEWFAQPGYTPTTELPSHWSDIYKEVVERRIQLIATDSLIGAVEQPSYKRPWRLVNWPENWRATAQSLILDRLCDKKYWYDRQGRPAPKSVAQVSDDLARDPEILRLISVYAGRRDPKIGDEMRKLISAISVPYLSSMRLTESGLRNREAWEEAWTLQRLEDSGQEIPIVPVPPSYENTDFLNRDYARIRGSLDAPRERLITYPSAERRHDSSLMLGWAGWNHVEQFLALAAIMDQLVADGAPDEQLVPLVAGMGELLPWVKQWHADIDPAYGVSMADFCAQQFEERAAQIDRSHDQLKAWRPPTPTGGRRTKVTQ